MRIVVLAGGLSPEREVSLSSGALITDALLELGHDVCLLDLWRGVRRAADALFFNQSDHREFKHQIDAAPPDVDVLSDQQSKAIGLGVLDICHESDLVFLALHGGIGENGQLQTVFDLEGIRYTGSGSLGAALAMDKDLSKCVFRTHGLPTLDWAVFRDEELDPKKILARFPLPLVGKPLDSGSSIGVKILRTTDELKEAVSAWCVHEHQVLIEPAIIGGREFSCGVLGSESLPAIEIRPKHGWYDYQAKYQAGATTEICPAPIPEELETEIRRLALAAHRALRLSVYSRSDILLDSDGRLWLLEVNTLPGMTPTSLVPQEAAAAGIEYPELCQKIIDLSLEKYQPQRSKWLTFTAH